MDVSPPSPSPPASPDWLGRLPEWARRRTVIAAVLGGVALVVVLALTVLRPPAAPAPTLTLPQAGAATNAGSIAGPTASTTVAGLVTVHAAGAVASPGIYALASGARVADVVTAAGGPLAEADLDRLNLAAKLADGDRVYVPRKGESLPAGPVAGGSGAGSGSGGPTTSASAGPIDLNTATIDQLDTLPGIGPATAQAIIAYRTRHGRFRSVTELLEVPGIGPSKLEAVRPLVRV
ncbi:MAG TPA: helix-hairpin-helix domain-containing protein [Actinomycetes bacterium]|nr:helix-hairpin-helix domain-containing protein [Actinomycetes bacterium]